MIVSIEKAIELLKSKHVVAVPSETVFGLAASIQFPEAIKKIFEIMDVNRIDNGGVISYKNMSDFLNKMIMFRFSYKLK
jgi:L-threonylcarbamoyladenylate synthase